MNCEQRKTENETGGVPQRGQTASQPVTGKGDPPVLVLHMKIHENFVGLGFLMHINRVLLFWVGAPGNRAERSRISMPPLRLKDRK
jgi:hypothetical protein